MRQMSFFDLDPEPAGDVRPVPAVDHPPPVRWQGFSLDHGEQAAIADFRRRYGCEPATVRQVPGALLVGPVPTFQEMTP